MQNTYARHKLAILLLSCLLFLPGLSLAQPLNYGHPLAKGLFSWWLAKPPYSGGSTWWALAGTFHGTLLNMANGFGWQPSSRSGWAGSLVFEGGGTSPRVDLGTYPAINFLDMTWTVQLRFRTTNVGTAYLITNRDISDVGGWWLRAQSDGSIMARIYGSSSSNVAASRSTVSTGLNTNAWHSLMAVFTSNTVTQASNIITLYVDGLLEAGTGSPTGTDAAFACDVCQFTLGATGVGSNPFAGALDDIRIWTRGLSAAEAMAVHRCQPPDFCGLLEAPEAPAMQTIARTKRRVVIE